MVTTKGERPLFLIQFWAKGSLFGFLIEFLFLCEIYGGLQFSGLFIVVFVCMKKRGQRRRKMRKLVVVVGMEFGGGDVGKKLVVMVERSPGKKMKVVVQGEGG